MMLTTTISAHTASPFSYTCAWACYLFFFHNQIATCPFYLIYWVLAIFKPITHCVTHMQTHYASKFITDILEQIGGNFLVCHLSFPALIIWCPPPLRFLCFAGSAVQRPLGAGEPPRCVCLEPLPVQAGVQLPGQPGPRGVQAISLPRHRGHPGYRPQEALWFPGRVQCQGLRWGNLKDCWVTWSEEIIIYLLIL